MNHINKFILFVVANGILLLIIGFFVRNDFDVEREIIIPKSETQVFRYIKFLKNQEHFLEWIKKDAKIKKAYLGIDGQPGFVVLWESKEKKIGKLKQELVSVTENDRIQTKFHLDTPFQLDAKTVLKTEFISNNFTRVSWKIHGNFNYPSNLKLLFVDMNLMLGTPLEVSLKNLKTSLQYSN